MPGADARGPCVLTLDVGTSSARTALYDAVGAPVGGAGPEARARYDWRATPDGGMETDAEALFRRVVEVLDAALARARAERREVAAVSSTGFWHSLLAVNARGAPLTPVYGWGDNRAAAAALALRERLDEEEVHRRTGCFFHPSYPAARLLWLCGAAGDTFPRASAWMSFGEYLESRLFGVRRASLSMASGTGLMDVERCRWDAEVLEAVGVEPARLSELVDTDAPTPPLLPEWRARWPELAEVPWIPVLGDGACANAGSGAVGARRTGLSVGTSAAVRTLREAEHARVPAGLWCYRLDRRRRVTGRALSNAGNAVAFLRGQLRLPPPAEAEAAVAAMPPDAHGLTVVPSLLGERAPGWERWGGASVLGMKHATTPEQLLRAWMEAVAHRLAAAHEALEEGAGGEWRVVAGGGALRASPAWARILADALGRSVTLTAEAEASSRGAALVALERLGLLSDLSAAPDPGGVVLEPDPDAHARYRAARRRQEEAEALLATLHPD